MVMIRVIALPRTTSRIAGFGRTSTSTWSAPDIASWETVAAEAMEDWKRSPSHRKNLLREQATHMGLGVAGWTHDGKNHYKIVQIFIDDCISSR